MNSHVDAAQPIIYRCGMNDNNLLNKLGGTSEVARTCRLHRSAVSHWRKNGIPRAWRIVLEAALKAAKNAR